MFGQCGEPFGLRLRAFKLGEDEQRYRVGRQILRQFEQCFSAVFANLAVWDMNFQQLQIGKQTGTACIGQHAVPVKRCAVCRVAFMV